MSQYPPPPGYQPAPANHPQATLILILGILSLVVCGLLGPVAWVMGNRAKAEIDAAGGAIGGRDMVQAGRIIGIIATVLMVLALLVVILVFAVGIGTATVNS
ncbi:MAG: DUF4190 domain-containing protein [Nocardioidaceae bacterium]